MFEFFLSKGLAGRLTLAVLLVVFIMVLSLVFAVTDSAFSQVRTLVIVDKWEESSCDLIEARNCSATYWARTIDGEVYGTLRPIYKDAPLNDVGVYRIRGVVRPMIVSQQTVKAPN